MKRPITFHALDGYAMGAFSLEEVRQRSDILLAYDMNGEALVPIQGYPLKLVLPGMAGLQNVRWLKHITLSTDEPSFELLHYPIHTRILAPDFRETIAEGTYTIQGMAIVAYHWLVKCQPEDQDCPKLAVFNRVDFGDFARLATDWGRLDQDLLGNLNLDSRVDQADLAILMDYWLTACQP